MSRSDEQRVVDSRPPRHPSVVQVADAYLHRLAEVDPAARAVLGGPPHLLLPELSPDAFEERHRLGCDILAQARVASARTLQDRVLQAALIERLESDVALHECGFSTRLLAPLATPVHAVRTVLDDLSDTSEEHWGRIRDHLDCVPGRLADYRATLDRSARAGNVVARRQVDVVADQCASWVDTAGADFFVERVRPYAGAGPLRSELDAAAQAAGDAVAEFARWLRDDLRPRAASRDAVGAATYALTARAFLGVSDLDAAATYDYGWSELARLRSELEATAREVTHDGVLAAVDLLDREPAWQVPAGPALVDWLQRGVDEATLALDGEHFDIPPATRSAECRMAPATSGVMYYTPPDPGLTRPGRIWWSTPPGVSEVAAWRSLSVLHHEGLPGHHLQHAVTIADESLHPWQRFLCQVHGYAEGWAHYAEGLAAEIGLCEHPAARMSMILGQIWRAARVVIDLGLHLDLPVPAGNGCTDVASWSVPAAIDLLTDVALLDRHTAEFEVDRYLGWPGQALAFTVGARTWRDARRTAEVALGDEFRLKDFHMRALGLGPMGLGPLTGFLAELFTG